MPSALEGALPWIATEAKSDVDEHPVPVPPRQSPVALASMLVPLMVSTKMMPLGIWLPELNVTEP